jgi:AcrR family transcriptional regulator
MGKPVKSAPISTDVKIKNAAHKIFLTKGFAAATVREVAKEAGVNVALVNYYFGTKKKLFDAVMMEKIGQLFGSLIPILSNERTTLHQKIDDMVSTYVDYLLKNPDVPAFIVSETRKQNVKLISASGANMANIQKTHFMKQLRDASGKNDPLQLLISLAGMVIFPFIVKPSMIQSGIADEKAFQVMMQERKKAVPAWMKAILGTANR